MARFAPKTVKAVIDGFNEDHMVVNEGGKPVVYKKTHDPVLNRRIYISSSFDDFKNAYLNVNVTVPGVAGQPPTNKKIAKVWLDHTDRRQYLGGIVYDPTEKLAGTDQLNLWEGFAFKPKKGKWDLLQAHIRDVICAGDVAHYDFTRKTLARMVQLPGEQGEVALVLRGKEGTGKGILGNAMVKLFGQHGFKISSAQHLVGNFNGHLQDCSLLFADEAFWAGDKKHVGVLKSLITEDILTIEDKYKRATQARNCVHIIMASNEDWIVPASLESRRFLVFDVPDTKRGNHAYFKAIADQLSKGGYEAMLYDLQHEDLAGWNHRDIPTTKGLVEQRKRSLDTTMSWWVDCLSRGYVYEPLNEAWGLRRWFGEVPTELFYASYVRYARIHKELRTLPRETLGAWLMNVMKMPKVRPRNVITGENRAGQDVVLIEALRANGYAPGTCVDDAREKFTELTGLTFEWTKMSRFEDMTPLEIIEENVVGVAPRSPAALQALRGKQALDKEEKTSGVVVKLPTKPRKAKY